MNLAAEMHDALGKQVSLQMLREILCHYKDSGGTQQEAYVILEKIRDQCGEESQEDLVLELMDFVSVFCTKDQRIWDDMLIHS